MKKEIVSALSAEPPKVQRAPLPSTGPVAAEAQAEAASRSPQPATNAPNGKSNGGDKQEKSNLPSQAALEASSVLTALIALKKGICRAFARRMDRHRRKGRRHVQ
jgi:hypothetical protein